MKLKPFLSVVVVVSTMLVMVCLKMQTRSLGYQIYQLTKLKTRLSDSTRLMQYDLSNLIRPDRIERLAETHLDLLKASRHQVIKVSGDTYVQ